jgi:hypothetical protein
VKKKEKIYTQLLDKAKKMFPDTAFHQMQNTCLLLSLILLKETINLNKLKNHVGSILGNTETLAASHYRRLTRYFDDGRNHQWLWKLLLSYAIKQLIETLDRRTGGKYLVMDGTSWNFGLTKFHFLTLSVLFKGVSIPIFWIELSKKGHSNLNERKALIKMAGLLYDLRGMTLLADREYKGRAWFEFLDNRGIFFAIRLALGDYKKEVTGGIVYSHLCKKARKGLRAETTVNLAGKTYRLVGTADAKDDNGLLLILSNRFDGKPVKLLNIYRLRWKIETMFFHLKSNGFSMEDMGMTEPKKVRLLVALIVLAYVLCVCQGMREFKKIRRQSEKHGGYSYESIFRKGYGSLAPLFLNIVLFLDYVFSNFGKKNIRLKPK